MVVSWPNIHKFIRFIKNINKMYNVAQIKISFARDFCFENEPKGLNFNIAIISNSIKQLKPKIISAQNGIMCKNQSIINFKL
jgi:hypothetical protein